MDKDKNGRPYEMDRREKEFLYWLCHVPVMGAVTIRKLFEMFQSFEAVFNIEGTLLTGRRLLKEEDAFCFDDCKKRLPACREELYELENRGVRFITPFDEAYPARLRSIHGYPMGLFVKGEFPEKDIPAVSIVGARSCTNYGKQMAEYLSSELGRRGIGIISGLACGVDGAAHKGALKAGAKTYGILGCGIHICYPRENYELYERMIHQGGLITEFMPNEPPKPQNFPMRNRVISGLSDVIVVVEARKKSGSLITASLGLDQGKEIFALPGRVSDPLSEGCNHLIRDGAGILLSPEDVLEYFAMRTDKLVTVQEKNKYGLAKNEKMVYSCLDLQPTRLEEIVRQSGLSVNECLSSLLELELSGMIVQTSHQYYGKKL